MKQVILALVLSVVAVNSANATPYDQYFATNSGKHINSAQAILEALNGGMVYKCTSVESKVSKSGTSIGVRNVKKPKIAKAD